jgi:hypothetical protein
MKKVQLLSIEGIVIDSMINNGAKQTLRRMFNEVRVGSRRTPSLLKQIIYYIRLGYSTLESYDDVERLYRYSLYLERNGDKNEDENILAESQK